jgi:type I restriction enzyme M protein
MIETMHKSSGRMAVIVPHGVLFRGGAEGKIRQKLVEENLLDAVIGLPAGLFYGTGIPAAILVFKRNKKDNSVLFIDSSQDFDPGTPQNKLRKTDIAKIVKVCQKRNTVAGYAYLSTFEEIKENDFNLNIPRYIDTFIEEEIINISATQKAIAEIETQLTNVKKKMKKYLGELRIND